VVPSYVVHACDSWRAFEAAGGLSASQPTRLKYMNAMGDALGMDAAANAKWQSLFRDVGIVAVPASVRPPDTVSAAVLRIDGVCRSAH
jgi:hypothetical protein